MSNYNDSDEEVYDMYSNRPTLEFFPNNLNNEIHEEEFYLQEREPERLRTEKRLNDMSKQISELTSLVRSVIQKDTPSPREENALYATTSATQSRSDSLPIKLYNPKTLESPNKEFLNS